MKRGAGGLAGQAVVHRGAQKEKPASGSRGHAVTHATDAGFVQAAGGKVGWRLALEGLEREAKEFGLHFEDTPEGRQLV